MTKPFNYFVICTSLCLASGCSTLAPGTQVENIHERDGVDMGLIPAEYREVYFTNDAENDRHCRAPGPDFTVQASSQLGVSVPTGESSETLSSGQGQAALSLGGRTPSVLLTRELMYRACEMSSNIKADKETTINIYADFLKAVIEISKSQTEQGTASSSDSILESTSSTTTVVDSSSKRK
jgi:hypothetical protein